jgi:MoxR-like ATPase
MAQFKPVFSGNGESPHPDNVAPKAHTIAEPYLPHPELVQAVNLAIFLKRPLLLEGEAGSGKSRLAHAIAYELGLPLHIWNIRSTSKAKDGLYQYDAVLRLHDVQVQKVQTDLPLSRDPSDPKNYRTFGALGAAFTLDYPAVVLIDEIDKADIDFPNDLLTVLEEPRSFSIPETGEEISAKHVPIVIITSNKEKGNLPKPFLRRCIYYYVEFPSEEKQLTDIINLHHQNKHGSNPDPELLSKAIPLFLDIRKNPMQKPPGTSELLDWIEALHYFDKPYMPHKLPKSVDKSLPYVELLYKLRTDLRFLNTGS